jgi:hypothetical protein
MAIPILTREPTEIVAGDSVSWRRNFDSYPAPTWVLSYTLINAQARFAFSATPNEGAHLVTLAAAVTALWPAGDYQWQAYLTSGAERLSIAQGALKVRDNFNALSTLDVRSEAKKIIDAIDAVMMKKATADQQEYQIRGRMIKKIPIAELVQMRGFYAGIYANEQNAERVRNGLPSRNSIYVRTP